MNNPTSPSPSPGIRSELPQVSVPTGSGGCCGGDSCGTPTDTPTDTATRDNTTSTDLSTEQQMSEHIPQNFQVTGMTCGHCASAVIDELQAIGGVEAVEVDLVAGGTSTMRVQSARPLDDAEVRAALDEAGKYTLA